jgi:hypothetical protein
MFQCTANLTAAVPFPSLSQSPSDVELDSFCIIPLLAVSKSWSFGLNCTSICTRGICSCICGIHTEFHCIRLECWCMVCITSYGLRQITAYNPKFALCSSLSTCGFKRKEVLNCVGKSPINVWHDITEDWNLSNTAVKNLKSYKVDLFELIIRM